MPTLPPPAIAPHLSPHRSAGHPPSVACSPPPAGLPAPSGIPAAPAWAARRAQPPLRDRRCPPPAPCRLPAPRLASRTPARWELPSRPLPPHGASLRAAAPARPGPPRRLTWERRKPPVPSQPAVPSLASRPGSLRRGWDSDREEAEASATPARPRQPPLRPSLRPQRPQQRQWGGEKGELRALHPPAGRLPIGQGPFQAAQQPFSHWPMSRGGWAPTGPAASSNERARRAKVGGATCRLPPMGRRAPPSPPSPASPGGGPARAARALVTGAGEGRSVRAGTGRHAPPPAGREQRGPDTPAGTAASTDPPALAFWGLNSEIARFKDEESRGPPTAAFLRLPFPGQLGNKAHTSLNQR